MIARIWQGIVQTGDADVDADYIRETGFAESTVTHFEVVDQVSA
jgi:hypothetical protein